jgi:hypothetical protein
LPIEFIKEVLSCMSECIGNGGTIANVVVTEGSGMNEGIGNRYEPIELIVGIGGSPIDSVVGNVGILVEFIGSFN